MTSDLQTVRYYDQHAIDASKLYRAAAGGVSEWFPEAFGGCARILDIGCGAGRNRYVIRINGGSMEPELNVGDRVVFEYHRSPRTPNQIVIANFAELGITSDLATDHAVKRLLQDADQWIFKSTNPHYDDIRVPKQACAYPILGIMVGRL